MRTTRILAALLALAVLSGCGDDTDDATTATDSVPATPVTAAGEDADAASSTPVRSGFDSIEDVGLAVLRVSTPDIDGAEAVYDEYGDIDGWLGSYDYGGGAEATVGFSPYAEALEAAVENHETVLTALQSLGPVSAEPYVAVVARFRAAPGSPLDEDAFTASDAFDDLAGCDWDGGSFMEDHVWYCERPVDEEAAGTARAVFAEQAGIDADAVELTLYR